MDEGAERRAERHFHQPGVAAPCRPGEDLGAGALAAAGFREPRGTQAMMGATLYQVSTLLMLVGYPHRPFCAGNGGRGRGRPAWPSSEAISAVSSPQTKAPAPSTISILKLKPRPRMSSPRKSVFFGLLDGALQAVNGQRIFRAHVDDALVAPVRSRRSTCPRAAHADRSRFHYDSCTRRDRPRRRCR